MTLVGRILAAEGTRRRRAFGQGAERGKRGKKGHRGTRAQRKDLTAEGAERN